MKAKTHKKKYSYILYEVFDGQTQNEIEWSFYHKLVQDQSFDINDVTYEVLETDFFDGGGKAIVQMTRYRIGDEATQFVHVCPAKKDADDKMDRDDVVDLKKQIGQKEFDKQVKRWKKQQKRVKLKAYNRLEITCPFCKVVFWKVNNSLPAPVEINGVRGKAVLRK